MILLHPYEVFHLVSMIGNVYIAPDFFSDFLLSSWQSIWIIRVLMLVSENWNHRSETLQQVRGPLKFLLQRFINCKTNSLINSAHPFEQSVQLHNVILDAFMYNS